MWIKRENKSEIHRIVEKAKDLGNAQGWKQLDHILWVKRNNKHKIKEVEEKQLV